MRRLLSLLARRWRALAHRAALDREMDDEMRLHLELEAQDLKQMHGFTTGEARRRAAIAFGGVDRYKEAHRDARGVRWLDELAQDVRYATRTLLRSPGFTLSAVGVLALGIGATTAIFSAVDAVLLARLPYPREERLVRINTSSSPTSRWNISAVDVRAIEAQQRSLSAFGALRTEQMGVSAGRTPERMLVGSATSGFFRALGVRPAYGRLLEPGDDRPGAPPVAVVTHAFAARMLGGAATAVGRTLMIDGAAHAVVGVLPPSLTDLAGVRAEVWPILQLRPPQRRGPFTFIGVARLADGVTLDAARRELSTISERIFPEWAASFQDRSARLTPVPLRESILRDSKQTLAVFVGAVALVLLIAVANVASLMLVRAMGRGREVAMRTVLGATRGRLVRLMATESFVLTGVGAVAGIAIGAVALSVFKTVGPRVPRLYLAQLDARAVIFATATSLVCGMIVGAYPVALLLRRDMASALRAGDRAIGAGRATQALRAAFVIAEFALALPLLTGAGLLLNSFLRLQRVDAGFDAAHALAVRVSLPAARYSGDTAVSRYWLRALQRVRELPGVVAAGLGDAVPPSPQPVDICCNNFDLVDHPVLPGGSQPASPWATVTREYFDALGVPLLEGRLFSPADTAAAPPVVVVSRSWARRFFPEGNAVGRQLVSGGCTTCSHTTVVGVVADVKYEGLGAGADAVYSPLTQGWMRDLHVFVRTNGSPASLVAPVRAALQSVDAGVPVADAAPMEDRVYASVAQPRHWTGLLGAFAAAALVLAAVGIFGMLSYTVSARSREIGVRMALGARQGAVVAMVVQRGMRHAAIGAALGLAASLAGTRSLKAVLFDVSATDPATIAAVTLLLLSVALVACWLPARRAAAIDPVESIRAE